MRETFLTYSGLSCLLSMIVACSGDPTPPAVAYGSAPQPERIINVFNWTDFIDPAVLADFQKEYGIKVNYGVYESNEQLETTLLTGHSNYDIAVPGGSFFERGIKAGLYEKLDKSQLPNLKGVDPVATAGMAAHDPDNLYGADYMWLTTVGIGYDVSRIRERMADAPVDSWRMIFDPAVIRRFQDCGVSVLDSPDDVVSAVMFYLGKNPNTQSLEDLKAAEDVLLKIRPYVRSINSANYIGELANADLCLALGWAGDITQARWRSKEAATPANIEYSIPREGSSNIFDVLVIPAGAPHRQNAHLFINYMLRPDIAARNTNATKYANSILAATALVDPQLTADRGIYPPAAMREKLIPPHSRSLEFGRAMNRLWTKFRTGS